MSVLFLFVDGVGIGKRDTATNPFTALPSKYFTCFAEEGASRWESEMGGLIVPLDSCLGVKGLPQSGSGQTSLFTGINSQKAVGRHVNGFPNIALRKMLRFSNLLKDLAEMGRKVTFANVYHRQYFERKDRYISASTWVMKSSGARVRYLDAIAGSDGVNHDLTNDYLIKEGYDVPGRTAKEAGQTLARIAERHDLTLFEYVKTDVYGHRQNMKKCTEQVRLLDDMLDGVLANLDLRRHTVLLTSDHGNIEDLSVRTHTRNPVPLMVWGKWKERLASAARRITDVTPLLIDSFNS